MEAVLQQQLVYVSPKQRHQNHIYSFNTKICKLPGFQQLRRRDQLVLMTLHIKQLNINPRNPRTLEEFDAVCQAYGRNPAMIGDPIPLSEAPYFQLTVDWVRVWPDGREKIVKRTLEQETTQWLIDNGYCLGPRAMNFDNILCLMRRESCDPRKQLAKQLEFVAIMGISLCGCLVALKSIQNLKKL